MNDCQEPILPNGLLHRHSFRYASRLFRVVMIATKYYPRSLFFPTVDIWSTKNISAFFIPFANSLFHRCKHDISSFPNPFCRSHVNQLDRVSCNRFAIVEWIQTLLVVIPAETILVYRLVTPTLTAAVITVDLKNASSAVHMHWAIGTDLSLVCWLQLWPRSVSLLSTRCRGLELTAVCFLYFYVTFRNNFTPALQIPIYNVDPFHGPCQPWIVEFKIVNLGI